MATATASISPKNRDRLNAIAAHWPLVLGFLILAVPTMATLGREVWVRESGAHGPIVLATGAWLLMTQRLHGLEREGPSWGVALIAIPALALYTFGRAYDFIALEAAGLYAMMLAMALRLIGFRSMVQNWFPFFYLAFMVPPQPAPIADQAEAAGYRVRRVLQIPTPFRHGDWYWDEKGAPATGRMVITVDLKAQTLSVFRDGHEIGTAVVLYGADAKPTPTGVYPITQKDADHVSNIYDAPMPYMLRLTNDGISVHGSADMSVDGATHGCIGTPVAFARKLFAAVKLGDVVIVTNGETLRVGEAIGAAG